MKIKRVTEVLNGRDLNDVLKDLHYKYRDYDVLYIELYESELIKLPSHYKIVNGGDPQTVSTYEYYNESRQIEECELYEYYKRQLDNIRHPLKHHSPSPGYNHLYNETAIEYPKKRRKLFCKHKDTVDIRVGDADPGWMHTSYIHTVCKDCGRLIKVNGEDIKRRIYCNE